MPVHSSPPPRPWSRAQLARLGKAIRDGYAPRPTDPPYDDVMAWYNEVATWVQGQVAALDWQPLLGTSQPVLVSRPKTIDTLRQKLQRTPDMQLATVQDVAGVRFEAEMSLDQQDGVSEAIAGLFGEAAITKDLRLEPHSGYRAVHIWLRLEGSARVEVQIRTHLQGRWANMFERAADVFGREIRYGELPDDPEDRELIERLISLSVEGLSLVERVRNRLARLQLHEDDARRGLLPTVRPMPPRIVDSLQKTHRSSRNAERRLMEQMTSMQELLDKMQSQKEFR